MPCFVFSCPEDSCTEWAQDWRPKWTADRPECKVHLKEMDRDWHREARSHIPGSSFPYVTKNISGEPIEVRNEGHLRELCKQYGVTPRNDAAWAEPMQESYDLGRFNWRTREWEGRGYKKKEGSGMGVKGVWY